jgi:predicted ATPase
MQTQSGVPIVIGRSQQREELLEALRDCVSGRGSVLLISGEPGIGKTTLCEEVARRAAGLGVSVAWGRCWEGSGAPSYWPWIQILRPMFQGTQAIGRESTRDRTLIARLIPELRELESGPSVDGTSGELGLVARTADYEIERFRLFQAVTALLVKSVEETPLLLILEDCHAADEASLLLTNFLARQVKQQRIAVLVSYRDAEVRLLPRVAELIGDLAREGKVIDSGNRRLRACLEAGRSRARNVRSVLGASSLEQSFAPQ